MKILTSFISFQQWCSVHDIHAPAPTPEDEDDTDSSDRQGGLSSSSDLLPPASQGRRGNGGGLSRLAEFLYGADDDTPNQDASSEDEEEEEAPADGNASEEDDDEENEEEGGEAEEALSVVVDQTDGRRTVRIRSEAAARRSRQLLDAFIRRRLQQGDPRQPPRQQQQNSSSAAGPSFAPPPRRGATARDRGVVLFSPELSLAGGNWVYFGTPRAYRRGPDSRPSTSSPPPPHTPRRMHRNRPRLTHYLEEANTGKGYIKEQCFSPCGRVLCSPFGFGLRLLAFTPDCADLAQAPPVSDGAPARKLHEVGAVSAHCGHRDVVLSSSFEPGGYSIVTGCLGGRIVWHKPVL